jgi:bacillithiol system protein YtxJ
MSRLNRDWNIDIPIYLIDVLAHRTVSDAVEKATGVRHESPQFLVIRSGELVFAASHTGINAAEALRSLAIEEAG